MELDNKEWLEQKYLVEKLTLVEIGELVGRHRNVVGNYLRKHGISTPKMAARNPKLDDVEWLKEQYLVNYLSYDEIADILGTTKHVIYRRFKKLGIPGRVHTARIKELNDKEWLRRKYVDEKLSINDIAALIGCSSGAVGSSLVWSGVKLRNVKDALQNKYANGRWGKDASNYKGGRSKTSGGHITILSPEHPFATRAGYVMEHRLVMEEYLGRYLEEDWVIHHIDGDKTNNLLLNLMLLPDRAVHSRVHFEANKEIAYLKKMAVEGITNFPPYAYRCLPMGHKDTQNPFDL